MTDFKAADYGADSAYTSIKVVGVGGCGCNTINHLIRRGIGDVELIAINTDAQSLINNSAPLKVQIGLNLTRGLGSGCDPNKGRLAAEESYQDLKKILYGTRLVFITAGLGNGTGTGAAPIVAEAAKECGALVVAVVTKPFSFEGKNKAINADIGLGELVKRVNAVIEIDNNKVLRQAGNLSLKAAFEKIDDVLYNSVSGLCQIILGLGYMNVDMADVETMLQFTGHAMIGVGHGRGPNFVEEAVREAIHNPLVDNIDPSSAQGVIGQIRFNKNFPVLRFEEICNEIASYAAKDAVTKFGLMVDDSLEDGEIMITVALTGVQSVSSEEKKAPEQEAAAPRPRVRQALRSPVQEPDVRAPASFTAKSGDDELWEVPPIFKHPA